MKITPIRTHKITTADKNILKIVDQYIPKLKENSILAITSKIVSICEGSVVKIGKMKKEDLIRKEADFFLPLNFKSRKIYLTIKNNIIIFSSGIDRSNGNGYFILWPKNPQNCANKIRKYLAKKFSLKNFGVIITDSKSTILRRGTSGVAISHSGFLALNDYIGKKDVFGRGLGGTRVDVVDSLAIASVSVMGEGAEQTPMALISNVPLIKFNKSNPSKKELSELKVKMEDDYHKLLLESVKWKKGGGGK
ncbi:MAG TPA: coenzyme F420-0:L-glutamate ligase [Candidatus Moranbacteria bacterium]|nr:coenzyme F420-0:L-glutamate ligase [Candidatus Moranbacteria bacterium]